MHNRGWCFLLHAIGHERSSEIRRSCFCVSFADAEAILLGGLVWCRNSYY